MKTLLTLLLLALICFIHHTSTAPLTGALKVPVCCTNSTEMHIPKAKVRHVGRSNCGVKAIVVTTVCNKKLCIADGWNWAENLLKQFQNETENKQPTSRFNRAKCGKK